MKKFITFLTFLITSMVLPTLASADVIGTVTFPSNLTAVNGGSLLNNLTGLLIALAGILFFFLLLWGGIRYMLAGGDPKNTEAARKILTSALIGLLIVVGAYFITLLLGKILGYQNILNPTIPGLP